MPQLGSGEHVITLDMALRVRAVLSIVAPIGMGAGMGAQLMLDPESVPGGLPLPVVLFYSLFTTGMVLSGIDVLVGRTTVLSATGISWRRLLRRYRYRWSDIIAIRVNSHVADDRLFGGRGLNSFGVNLRVRLMLAGGKEVQPITPSGLGRQDKAFDAAADEILSYWKASQTVG